MECPFEQKLSVNIRSACNLFQFFPYTGKAFILTPLCGYAEPLSKKIEQQE
jgi:hypothetical protein